MRGGCASDDDSSSGSCDVVHHEQQLDDSVSPELNDLVPLSVDAPVCTDDNVYFSRSHHIKLVLINCCDYSCNRRYLMAILFIGLSFIGSVLIVLTKLFHQSLPNLLHFGGNSINHKEPICLSTQLLEGNTLSAENMILNQIATAFNNKLIGDDNILASGFLWNDDDAQTSKWRPQGVTTMHTENGFRFALVSWYGRADEGYADRGGRVSFVNLTDMPFDEFPSDNIPDISFYKYSHVLLVDESFCTLPGIHVGGTEYQNGTLYVADSRKGQQSIIEFDVANDLYEVPSSMEPLLGYRYLLQASSSFHTPIKPSFFSYDIDNHKFLVGTYAKCGTETIHSHQDSTDCFHQNKNKLLWFDKDKINLTSPLPCEHYFPEMQGAVSLNWQDETVIWTSSSYGAVSNSHLHSLRAARFGGGCPNVDLEAAEINTFLFPPGLEDLHIEEAQNSKARLLWSQTEFGVRQVFAVPIRQLL